jgi:hypothetical protein
LKQEEYLEVLLLLLNIYLSNVDEVVSLPAKDSGACIDTEKYIFVVFVE